MAKTNPEIDLNALAEEQSEKPAKKKKNKRKMDPVSKVILVISIIVFLGSGGYLVYKYFGEPLLEQMELASYKKDYHSEEPSTADNGVWNNEEQEKEEERLSDRTLASFKTIRELNSDVVGWINVPNTLVDYPVVQSKDNYFYLKHNVNEFCCVHILCFFGRFETHKPDDLNSCINISINALINNCRYDFLALLYAFFLFFFGRFFAC